MGYFRFFFSKDRTFFRAEPNPVHEKNPLNYYSLKVTKIHGDGVKNESAKTKTKTTGGAKRPSPQPV